MQKGIIMTKKEPLLVLPTGLPSSGKSTICRFLEEKYNFVRLCPEEERNRIYGVKNFDEFKRKFGENYKYKDQEVIRKIELRRDNALRKGENVVIDVFAANYYTRRDWFMERGFYRHKPESNFLIYLISDPEVLVQREIKRGRNPEDIKKFVSDAKWSAPTLYEELYTFLPYTNNSEQDLEEIMQQLPQHMGPI